MTESNTIINDFTLLIVEDEILNYRYLETFLINEEDVNYKILYAKNGQLAIDVCKQNPQIDLILMDLKMPLLNGYDATKQIRVFAPDIPIIAQTAYSTLDDKQKALDAGCNDFISKPINENDLRAILKKYLAY